MELDHRKKIAIIGAGVSGIVSAYLLSRKHDVTVYEKNDYVGGHTHTVAIPDARRGTIQVDTGFIVFNDRTYPLLIRFLSQLEIQTEKTDMSFSYTDLGAGIQYASRNFRSFFAQRKNLFSPSFWRLLYGILRFNRVTRERLHEGALSGISLGVHMRREGVSQSVAKAYVLPMAGAIWSAPDGAIRDFPAETFARFYENHGLLALSDHPQWYYIVGGSHSYVRAFLKMFSGRVLVSSPVGSIRRMPSGILVRTDKGEEAYDLAVIATHADQALRLLADPSPDEKRLLGVWTYAPNKTILHKDRTFLPDNEYACASWNYTRSSETRETDPVTLTYDMTRLQRLGTPERFCVTLNPWKPISYSLNIREMLYDHPMFSFDAIKYQKDLPSLNGQRNTFFCGSYFGYGFHEDGVRSAVEVGKHFGIEL
jgi:uncharacterized protein